MKASVPDNPIYVFENNSGFTQSSSDGAFSWVGPFDNPNDWGQSYLAGFYSTALSHATEHTFASTKKGFNDTMAAWGMNRIINQNCGSTWINTFKEIDNYYSQSNQLESLQLVTWNDYEEGTEIETGIDNCMSVSQPQVIGTTLSWSVVASSSLASLDTVDHFAVYATTDGSELTSASRQPPQQRDLGRSLPVQRSEQCEVLREGGWRKLHRQPYVAGRATGSTLALETVPHICRF